MATTYATTQVKPGPHGNASLNLDGVPCGLIGNLSGGGIYADIVEEEMGPAYFTKKHVGQVRYEEFTIDVGFAMSKAVFDWIAASWQMNYQRKNGSVVACDAKLEAKSERQFFNALITETTIPALDVSAKEPAFLTVKFAPELVRTVKASGKVTAADPRHPEKIFLPGNFKLEIEGLDCTRVSRIDAFTVKQDASRDEVGGDASRDQTVEPGKLRFPNLKFTFAEVTEHTWLDYFEDFVVKGNCFEDKEKTGTLTLLSPNRQQALASIHFFNLGIFRVGHASQGAGDKLKLATAEMYCERMEFHFGK